jgi:hypothetical protein
MSPSETISCVILSVATSTRRTPLHEATVSSADSGTRACTARPEAETIRAPSRSRRLSRSGPALPARMSTSAVPARDTRAPGTARGIRVAPARRRSVTTSRLSSLRSAGDSDVLTCCSAAI